LKLITEKYFFRNTHLKTHLRVMEISGQAFKDTLNSNWWPFGSTKIFSIFMKPWFYMLLFFVISIDLFWNEFICPFQWIPCGGPFYLVTSRFFGWHYVACERISTPTEWIHRTSKTDLFWSIYVKYKKIKLSEKNSVRRKMDLSNQKITRRSEIDICSRKYGRRNYLSYL